MQYYNCVILFFFLVQPVTVLKNKAVKFQMYIILQDVFVADWMFCPLVKIIVNSRSCTDVK